MFERLINMDGIEKSMRNGCLTNATRRSLGIADRVELNLSIHPSGTSYNTSKPWKGKGKLRSVKKRLDARRLDRNNTVLSKGTDSGFAYHQPGSMQI